MTLNFDRAVAANTFDAHRLIAWAADQGRQLDMVEALHRAHFTDGVDLGSRAALAAAGRLDRAWTGRRARPTWTGPAGRTRSAPTWPRRASSGVTSVPTFVIAGKYAVTGAQEPATLRAALDEVARREASDAHP